MKIEKMKHNHTSTQILKVGIFAMLMVAPLFASCSQLMYVTFNKNAYQSTQITGQEYYTTYEYETNEVNSADDLIVGHIYQFTINSKITDADYNIAYSNFFRFADIDFYLSTKNDEDLYTLRNNRGEGSPLRLVNTTTWFTYYQLPPTFNDWPLTINFIYQGENTISYITWEDISASDYLGEVTIHERAIQALDNAFYYGVEKMTESPLFNWTQNTALYTGIKAMTDNLQVQTNVIAVLVTYWTILTIIYIIIDIVLALFTKMTHLLVRSD